MSGLFKGKNNNTALKSFPQISTLLLLLKIKQFGAFFFEPVKKTKKTR